MSGSPRPSNKPPRKGKPAALPITAFMVNLARVGRVGTHIQCRLSAKCSHSGTPTKTKSILPLRKHDYVRLKQSCLCPSFWPHTRWLNSACVIMAPHLFASSTARAPSAHSRPSLRLRKPRVTKVMRSGCYWVSSKFRNKQLVAGHCI